MYICMISCKICNNKCQWGKKCQNGSALISKNTFEKQTKNFFTLPKVIKNHSTKYHTQSFCLWLTTNQWITNAILNNFINMLLFVWTHFASSITLLCIHSVNIKTLNSAMYMYEVGRTCTENNVKECCLVQTRPCS